MGKAIKKGVDAPCFPTNKDDANINFVIALYLANKNMMLATARQYGPPDQAEDNVHDAFIHLLRHTDLLKCLKPEQLTLYLYQTVKYATWDRNKSDKRRRIRESISLNCQQEIPAVSTEQRTELFIILYQLSERDRDLLCYYYLWGYSLKEIASLMQIRPGNVGKALQVARQRALRLLREGD